jgi:putative SOS response-associated peptidase YedK
MCGRFTRTAEIPEIAVQFGVKEVASDLGPSYNIAPTQDIAVIISEGERQLVQVRWGLIPSWADDPKIGNKLINARAETLVEKPSFKNAFRKRRCLIVADGFYEWQKSGATKKPIYIRLKSGRPFGFAGLYETWISPDGEEVTTCTIITTEPNELMKPIHNRMPVIIPKDKEDIWLHTDSYEEELVELLKPYPANLMEAYEVSRMVNSPGNNSPECIEPAKGSDQ